MSTVDPPSLFPLKIVSIESESAYAPEDLFPAAIQEIRARIAKLKRAAEALAHGGEDDEEAVETKGAENLGAVDGDIEMMDS